MNLRELCAHVKRKTGLRLSRLSHSEFEVAVAEAVSRRRSVGGFKSQKAYYQALKEEDALGTEVFKLVDEMNVNKTFFFREPSQFRKLKRILKKKPGPLRLWSAGCSTGQEAYTLAFTLSQFRPKLDFTVLGTDINRLLITYPSLGIYSKGEVLRGLSKSRASKYFIWTAQSRRYRVRPPIKKRVHFEHQDLRFQMHRPKFHVIFCRNVLCHLEPKAITQVLENFKENLLPEGLLFTSTFEEKILKKRGWLKVDRGTFRCA